MRLLVLSTMFLASPANAQAASTLDANFRLQSTGVSMFWPYLIVPISFGLQALRLALWRFGLREDAS